MRFYIVQALIAGVFYEWTVMAMSKDDAMRAVEVEGLPGVPHSMEASECSLQASVLKRPEVLSGRNAP